MEVRQRKKALVPLRINQKKNCLCDFGFVCWVGFFFLLFSSGMCSVHGEEIVWYSSQKSMNRPLWIHVISERKQTEEHMQKWKWARSLFHKRNPSNLQFYFGCGDSSLFRSFSTTTTVVCCLWNPHAPAQAGFESAWNLAYQTVSGKPAVFVMPDCIWIKNWRKM